MTFVVNCWDINKIVYLSNISSIFIISLIANYRYYYSYRSLALASSASSDCLSVIGPGNDRSS